MFSVHSVPNHLAMIWSEVTASWDQFRVANLFGTGTYVVPAFALLSVVGLAFLQFRRFEISALLAGTVFFIATTTLRFVDGRFYLPILFLLVPLAVLPAEWAIREVSSRAIYFWASRCSRCSFSAVSVIRLNQALNPRLAVLKRGTPSSMASQHGKSILYDAQKKFARTFKDEPGIVLSAIDPAYLNALLPKRFVAAPVDGNHPYCFSRLWHYGKAEAVQLAQSGFDHATSCLRSSSYPQEISTKTSSACP
jgi:hypothetical protein